MTYGKPGEVGHHVHLYSPGPSNIKVTDTDDHGGLTLRLHDDIRIVLGDTRFVGAPADKSGYATLEEQAAGMRKLAACATEAAVELEGRVAAQAELDQRAKEAEAAAAEAAMPEAVASPEKIADERERHEAALLAAAAADPDPLPPLPAAEDDRPVVHMACGDSVRLDDPPEPGTVVKCPRHGEVAVISPPGPEFLPAPVTTTVEQDAAAFEAAR
jgi:hypothetical protein